MYHFDDGRTPVGYKPPIFEEYMTCASDIYITTERKSLFSATIKTHLMFMAP